MKFSVLRSKEKKEQRNLEKLLNALTCLNPSATFKPKEADLSQICSDLSLKDLPSLSLPIGASFTINPSYAAKEYGFVNIKYKKAEYTIFAKGFEGSYLIV